MGAPQRTSPGIHVTEALSTAGVLELLKSGARHVVQREGLGFERALANAEKMISDPSGFLRDPLSVLAQSRDHGFARVCSAGTKKSVVIDPFQDFLEARSATRRILDRALLVADELFTNGAKNAWPEGSGLFEGPATEAGRVELFASAGEESLIIGCRDSFGRLEIDGVLDRIELCVKYGVSESIRGGSGGGRHRLLSRLRTRGQLRRGRSRWKNHGCLCHHESRISRAWSGSSS